MSLGEGGAATGQLAPSGCQPQSAFTAARVGSAVLVHEEGWVGPATARVLSLHMSHHHCAMLVGCCVLPPKGVITDHCAPVRSPVVGGVGSSTPPAASGFSHSLWVVVIQLASRR